MKTLIWSRRKKDFRIDWFSGTGAGGQHRNKCMNSCRLTDKETGIQTSSQEHRSAKQNLKSAFHKMVKLLEEYYKAQEKERQQTASFGAPRIRTYNECDDRVTDDEYGMQYSYHYTVGKDDISKIIEDRRRKMLTEWVDKI